MPQLPSLPELINRVLAALRAQGGTASAGRIDDHAARALGIQGGNRFRALMDEARAVLRRAGLVEAEDGEWSLAPGVTGDVADPEALAGMPGAREDARGGDPELADWRVRAASTGTLDPATRIAAALLRGRAAVEAGAPLRLEMEEMEALLRRSGSAVPPAPSVDSSAIDRAAGEISPAAADPVLLHLAERVLGILARLPRQPPLHRSPESGGRAAPPRVPPTVFCPPAPADDHGVGRDEREGGRTRGEPDFGVEELEPDGTDTVFYGGGDRDFGIAPRQPVPKIPRRAPVEESPPERGEAPAATPETPPASGTRDARPRFPDFRVLRGSGEEHDPRRPLTVGETYVLEVRVTPAPSGIPAAEGKPREPVIEPREAAPVTLTVTVDASSHVEVPEPLDSLHLPPEGASTVARFELRATEAKPAKLSVRIYYRLNLLARARVVAEVADEVDGDDPRPAAVVVVESERLDATFAELADMAPRDAHIDVTAEDGAYEMTLAFRKDEPGEAAFRARVRLSPEELEDALVRVRETLAAISAEPVFNQKLEGSKHMRARHLRTLAAEGRRLWGMLFHRDIDSAASELERVLKDAPLAPDSRLQISLDRGAEPFVFPWALLFPGDIPEEPAPPAVDGFWGTRYELEVRAPRTPTLPDRPFATGAGVKLAFALHPFPNAAEQEKLLARLETESGGKLRAGAPVRLKSEWLALLRNCDAQVLYFYTHGFTRQRKADVQGTGAGAPPASDADPDRDRTWIQVPGGRLYLDELQDAVSQNLRSEPLVFLNMCESAQMTPSLSESLVAFFLDRGARTVIGTECPMTIYFAHAFAERLLSQLLRGDRVGKALLDARRHFIESANNTLGFAYSLYGTAAFRFAPPVLPAAAGD